MTWIYTFNPPKTPDISEIGGKGRSLVLLTQMGFPTPPGFILTVAFFEPWMEEIKASVEWRALKNSPENLMGERCRAVMDRCQRLSLDGEQQKALNHALSAHPQAAPLILAVRSSSPEEDLQGASFAGGYQTVLGVPEDGLPKAIGHCFASAFGVRVWRYKKERGFPVDHPRIAVIVQHQLAADAAGVAFSLNPVNNCYDEAVINASEGLGESVVSGRVSPDAFIVDKVSRTMIDRKLGAGEEVVRLSPGGGTAAQTNQSKTAFSLSGQQVLDLTNLLTRVEQGFGFPVDIEWAYEGSGLFLLQARPITAYVPLPPAMRTRPGRPKLLYMDGTLAAQGLQRPLSVLGTDFMVMSQDCYFHEFLGTHLGNDPIRGIYGTLEGRMYINLSHQLKLTSRKRTIEQLGMIDSLTARILENIDTREYIPPKLPPAFKGLFIPKSIIKNIAPVWKGIRAYRKPGPYLARLSEKPRAFKEETRHIWSQPITIKEMARQALDCGMIYIRYSIPTFGVAETARFMMKKIIQKTRPDLASEAIYLERAFPSNTTVEMGLAMYDLSQFEAIKTSRSWPDLRDKMESGRVSSEFLANWNHYLETYGFRCPAELDIATPRAHETPDILFDQLRAMAGNNDPDHNPKTVFQQARQKREQTFHRLKNSIRQKSRWKARRFEAYYRRLVAFGGYREAHKYHIMWMVDGLRGKILDLARNLADKGRLDHPNQIFDLTFDDLEAVERGEAIDLRSRIEENTRFLKIIRQVRSFPGIIDSRGKIFNVPPTSSDQANLTGEPISPGIVRGKVKVLHSPNEKTILPGDILVARATDPGWTPLFVNAEGVILEVGGLLQHGALVAREYGKPCIAGIPDVTRRFQDGQFIEMDGLRGEIKFIS